MRAVPRQIRLLSLIAIALAAYVLSSAAQSKNSDGQSLIARAAEALGGRDRILKDQDADDRGLWPARLPEWRRQHHLVHRCPPEVDQI